MRRSSRIGSGLGPTVSPVVGTLLGSGGARVRTVAAGSGGRQGSQARKAVDAQDVGRFPVLPDAGFAFAVRPFAHEPSVFLEVHKGHAVAARVGDALRRDHDDRSGAFEPVGGEPCAPRPRSLLVLPDDRAAAVDPNDPRRSLEGAEHEDYPAVLTRWAIVSTPLPVRSR